MKQAERDNQQNNQIGITHLFDEINAVKEDISEVKQVLNNGIVKTTSENTDAIEGLREEVEQVKEVISKKENYKKGKSSTWQNIIKNISMIGSGIIGTLTALKLLELM